MAPKKTARLLAVAGVLVAALIVFVALRQPTSTSEDAEELVVFHPPTTLDARLGANKGRLSAGECGANVFVTDEDSDAVGSVIACAHSAHDLGRQYCGSTSSQGVVGLNWPCGFAPESMIILVRKPGYSQLRNARFVANPDEVTHVAVTMTQTDYRLQGRVEDIFGGPVEGAWIWATCKGDGSTWGSAWDADAVSSAVSSQAGEFSLGFTHNCKLDELLVKAEGYANYSQKND